MSYVPSEHFLHTLLDTGVSHSDAIDLISYAVNKPYGDVACTLHNIEVPTAIAQNILNQLHQYIPIAYITGRKEFYGYEFRVTTDTLIPRPETETLVESVLMQIPKDEPATIIDLYTGSGCILLAILSERKYAQGVGVDISANAIDVARQNADMLHVHDRCTFITADILSANFDLTKIISDVSNSNANVIITANPPYISESEYRQCEKSISHEPALALVASENGLVHYKKLLYSLKGLGSIRTYAEIGYNQANDISQYVRAIGFYMQVIKDLAGNDRVIHIDLCE